VSNETNENAEFLPYLKNKTQSLTHTLATISKLVQNYRNSQNEDDPLFQEFILCEKHLREYRSFLLWSTGKEEEMLQVGLITIYDYHQFTNGIPPNRTPAKIYQMKKS